MRKRARIVPSQTFAAALALLAILAALGGQPEAVAPALARSTAGALDTVVEADEACDATAEPC